MLLIPNLQESIVVVIESGNTYISYKSCTIKYLNPLKHFKNRFLVKAAAFVCDTCNSRTRVTIDDYVFSGFFPRSLSPNSPIFLQKRHFF